MSVKFGNIVLITAVVFCSFLFYGCAHGNNGTDHSVSTAPSGKEGGGLAAGGNAAGQIKDGRVSVKQFGAIGDGVADDTVAVENAMRSGKQVYIPKGHYRLSRAITIANDVSVYGDGDASVLDWKDSVPDGHAFNITGTFTRIAGIRDANENDYTVTFTADSGLKVGDVFCIANPKEYSWSPWRPYYRAGEMCEVTGVSGLTVRLADKLYDSYKGKDVNVYKMTSRNVVLRDFKVQAATPFSATHAQLLHIYGCKNPVVENITACNTEGGYSAAVFQKCFGVRAVNLHVYIKGTDSVDHGISINNCQRAVIEGGNFYGRRHGIAIGGSGGKEGWSVINRNIKIHNATVASVDQHSTDMHGCTEYITYDHCRILNGGDFAGSNNSYKNCEFVSRQNGVCIYGGEILGGLMKIENCSFKATNNPNLVKRGFLDFGGNSRSVSDKMRRDFTLQIKNCSLDLKDVDAPNSYIIRLVNRGSAKKINLNIDGLTLLNTSQKHTVLSIAKAGNDIPDLSDYIIVDHITGLSGKGILLQRENGYLNNARTFLQNF